MATNRTLLWKYLDREAYDMIVPHQHSFLPNPELNTVEECDGMLERAPWLPSYDEWADRLGLSEPFFLKNFRFQDAVFEASNAKQLVAYGRMFGAVNPSQLSGMALGIMNLGTPFAYGMLMRYLFDFSATIKDSVGISSSKTVVPENTFTVALHTRHPFDHSKGCDISDESICLDSLLSKSNEEACTVTVLSDRECTAQVLETWLRQKHNCSVASAPHTGAQKSHIAEHGPFAGIGFFQDWAFAAARSRDAFVGSLDINGVRSSSALIRESIEFYRKIDALKLGENPMRVEPLPECMMYRHQGAVDEHRVIGGDSTYNYRAFIEGKNTSSSLASETGNNHQGNETELGPSSDSSLLDIFHENGDSRAPLENLPLPVQLMEQYKQMHSVIHLRENPQNRRFAIGYYTCPHSAGSRLHEFTNGKRHNLELVIGDFGLVT